MQTNPNLYHIPSPTYWLTNVCVPRSLLNVSDGLLGDHDDLVHLHLLIETDKICAIQRSDFVDFGDIPQVNLQQGIVLPCFVDMHTHLDKGHIWQRNPNPDGSFAGAISAVFADYKNWSYEDIYRRMEFGLRCSFAHGTSAIRTHLDCPPELGDITIAVFLDLQNKWRDRLTLQPVSLITLDQYQGERGKELANKIAEINGILGGVAYMNPYLDQQLDRLLQLAKERNLAVDLHTDENGDANSCTLFHTAQAVLRNKFLGKVTCGHCCSLSVQSAQKIKETIAHLQLANISIVSLPLCNLYLQDRHANTTPRWRGVTILQELCNQAIPVSIASDNCRDPFYGFGDHDLWEVLRFSVQIAHLDYNYSQWIKSVNASPAQMMGLDPLMGIGSSADLVLFSARSYSELLARPQHDRQVLRRGQLIDTTLPSYRELDRL